MQNTTNYNLNKPDGNDFVKVEFLNENADIIDGKLKELEDGLDNIDFSSVNQAIAKAFRAIPDGNMLGGAGFNFNTIASNSVYQVGQVDGSIGGPPESWGILRDYRPATTYRIQEFTAIVGDRKYTRRCDYGLAEAQQWTPWKQVTFDNNIYQQWNQGFETYRRFPEYCKIITNWNDAIENGYYMGDSALSGPDNNWYMGEVIAHNDKFVTQRLMCFTEANHLMREYQRSMINGMWSGWIETSPRKLFQSVSNGKAAIANAITGKGVPTAVDAEFATMAANILTISTGKKFATGVANPGTAVETYVKAFNNVNAQHHSLVVSNLDFRPRLIIAMDSIYLYVYQNLFNVDPGQTQGLTTDFTVISSLGNGTSQGGDVLKGNAGAGYVVNGGFKIPVRSNTINVNWIAIE